ncbi:Disease resistance protein L6 [Linum perenne]
MVKCCKQGDDRIILPIFYKMKPRDVRHQEGSYKEAFQLYSEKYKAETIKEWKEALKEVGEMKGWSVKESDRQGVIMDEVRTKVLSHLMKSYKLVTDELVGIDSHVQHVTRLLNSDSGGVKIVGIHGMGSMGKTTITKAGYNEIYSQFDRFCFVEDVREFLSQSNGIVALQSEIISGILRTDYKVKNASEGLHVIKDRVCKHKVLVVLDDVNNLFEFDKILGKLDNFSPESRFIVTTRDKGLNDENEFWMHDHIRDLGRAIVREEDNQRPWKRSRIWSSEDALDILKSGEESDWVEVLRVHMKGTENLELTDKEFKKLTGLRYLEVSYGSLIGDFKGVLPNLRWLRLHGCILTPSDLNMKKLVILEMRLCPVMKDDWRGWSGTKVASNLKAIQLQFCLDIRTAPDLSRCRNLEWIDLEGCSEMSGKFHIGNLLKNLKLLRFSGTKITKLTGDIGALQNLQVFHAGNTKITKLTGDIGTLQNLQVLDAGNLMGKSFSPEIMNLPTSLNQLSLSSSIRVLNLSELKDLEELCFDYCDKLQYLGGLWKLSKLRKLELNYLSSCNSLLVEGEEGSTLNSLEISGLEILPNFANLNNLTKLSLFKFQVPEIQGLGDLIMLETLEIYDAQNLINLDGLENLSHLETLKLKHCRVLEKLPISLANLTKLQELSIKKCTQLAEVMSLGRMDALRSLSMRNCTSITKFPDLSVLTNLKTLKISGCTGLTEIIGIGSLKLLTELNMSDCSSVGELLDLSCLRNIVSLDISKCNQLKEVRGIESLELLEQLVMSNCSWIKKLADLSGCKKLGKLDISGCAQLAEVGGIERLESLKWLIMSDCSSVQELPDLSGLGNIESLDISGCNQLKEVTGIGSLELLEELSMRNCTSMKKLSDLSGCKGLRWLDIRRCVQLAEVSGIDKLEGLTVER